MVDHSKIVLRYTPNTKAKAFSMQPWMNHQQRIKEFNQTRCTRTHVVDRSKMVLRLTPKPSPSTCCHGNAHQIFCPDLAGVRGRRVRRPPESVTTDYVQLPRAILERHQLVTLAVDVMFVNRVPFLVSVARGLNLVTAEFTPSRTAKQLAAGNTRMMALYTCGGVQVGTVLMENEFEKLRNLMSILAINTTAAKEHVPEVECMIRLIKERGRGILNTLPFKKMPRLMLIELVYHVVLWLNAFPANSGVSESLSPREIVYQHKLDFAKHCKSPFGMYCKVHDELVPTNTMVTWSTPAIVLGPTGNL